jgi:malate dehydrogenase (oxaloacetate-decarboxylating)
METQANRVYESYLQKETPMEKYIYLMSLLDRNESLFYRTVLDNLEEMLPVVYTPTVGEAAKTFSHIFRRSRGLYVPANRIAFLDRILTNAPFSNVALIVVTDGERILGLGDQGIGGMTIPIGKLSLYVAGAGIHPALCLPICLDVGTNNEDLIYDPLYLGLKQRRLTDDAYLSFIEEFVTEVKRAFPHALLQWEDFGKDNALGLLNHYRERICSFNDDIQGTGAVALSAIMTALSVKEEKMQDQRFVLVGMGQAGYGIANAIVSGLIEEGLSVEQAKEHIYAVDINGLLVEGDPATPYQEPFLTKKAAVANWALRGPGRIDLMDVLVNAKATVLIGISAVGGSFSGEVLTQMSKNAGQPIILPLSNPTSKSECTAEDALKYTNGRCFIATGSPFRPVMVNGEERKIPQCNNMFVFPGMGLGAIISMTPKVTNDMFVAAAKAVESSVLRESAKKGMILPEIHAIRQVSENVAFAVARLAREKGLGIRANDERLRTMIKNAMWEPSYIQYRYAGKKS